MTHFQKIPAYKHAQGFSLVELMVGITLGLLVLVSITSVVVNSSNSRREIEKAGIQIENGRYAMQLLTSDIRLAGFFGDFDPALADVPATMPDPCSVAVADLKANIRLHIQGYDQGASAPSCISDLKADTDIIVVRRASTCVAGVSGCTAASAGTAYFQSTQCNTELDDPIADQYKVNSDTAALTLHKRDCATVSGLRKYRTSIYFVANNNNSGDGVPTLKRAELDAGSFSIVPLVEGVENLQAYYGIDTNNDGVPDEVSADPSSFNGCAGQACVANWTNVMTANISVLVRNTDSTTGFEDTKTYTLGLDSSSSEQTVGPFNDAYKRHAYSAAVRITNPAGRRE